MKTFIFEPPVFGTTTATVKYFNDGDTLPDNTITLEDGEVDAYIANKLPIYQDLCIARNLYLSPTITPDPLIAFSDKLDNLTVEGYFDSTLNVRIKGDNRAMTERWTPQSVSVLNLKNLGMPGSTELTTYDYNDEPITLTFDQFQGLMARYTVWFSDKFSEAATP
jgi:hypothetical protein